MRHGGGRRRLPTLDASEFRGIRPHEPGEPLNRVDWKSTAKTGSLMLREIVGEKDEYIQTELILMMEQLRSADKKKLYHEIFEGLEKKIKKQQDIAIAL